MPKYAVIIYGLVKDYYWSMHRFDCRDIERDVQRHGGYVTFVEASSPKQAAEKWIDDELKEMGHDVYDIKMHDCLRTSSKNNPIGSLYQAFHGNPRKKSKEIKRWNPPLLKSVKLQVRMIDPISDGVTEETRRKAWKKGSVI